MSDRGRLIGFAQGNRKDSTRAERVLWRELRGRRLGVRFRRQDPIGPYIVDFSCRSRRLIVETDGNSHTTVERDYLRDRWFIENGWTVLRFTDNEVLEDPSEAVDALRWTYENRWGFGSSVDDD